MLAKSMFKLKDLIIFVFVFSLFNDGITVFFGESILKIIFVVFLVVCFKDIVINIKKMNQFQGKLFYIFTFFLVSGYLLNTILDSTNDILSVSILVFAIFTITVFFSRYPLKKLLYFVWVSMMSSVVICFFSEPTSEWSFRVTGGTGDPNEFAAQLLVFLFVSIYLYTQNKNKLFIGSSLIFFTYGLFMAGSKSAFLVLAVIIIIYILRNLSLAFNYKSILALITGLILIMFIDFAKLEMISNMLDRADKTGTANTRINSWVAGYHMVEENPLLGVGIHNYASNTRKYAEVQLSDGSLAPHNTYIQVVAETGIIIFIIFIIFLGVVMLSNMKLFFYSQYKPLWFAMFSLLLMGLTLGLTYEKYFWVMLAIIIQVNFIIYKDKNENTTNYT